MAGADAAAAVTAKAVAVAEASADAAAYADALASADVAERGVMVSCGWPADVFPGLTHGRLTGMEEGLGGGPGTGTGSSSSISRFQTLTVDCCDSHLNGRASHHEPSEGGPRGGGWGVTGWCQARATCEQVA